MTGRSPNAISPLLRGLQDEGLIKRSANPADRRSHYLQLSAPGKRLAARLHKQEDAFVNQIMGTRAIRDLDGLEHGLQTIEERAGAAHRAR